MNPIQDYLDRQQVIKNYESTIKGQITNESQSSISANTDNSNISDS